MEINLKLVLHGKRKVNVYYLFLLQVIYKDQLLHIHRVLHLILLKTFFHRRFFIFRTCVHLFFKFLLIYRNFTKIANWIILIPRKIRKD